MERRHGRDGALRAIALIAGALVPMAATAPAAAQTVIETADLTGNGVVDTWTLDDNNDGWVDRMLVDANEDGVAELSMSVSGGLATALWIDTNIDHVYDFVVQNHHANGALVGTTIWRDGDQNGAWENAYFDGQLDGYFEWVLVDSNYDGAADTWVGNTAPPGRSATDEMARQVASQSAFQILVNAGIDVFGPGAWPLP